jgi:hypothetical protein
MMSSDHMGPGRGTVYGRSTPSVPPPFPAEEPPKRGFKRVIGFFDNTAKILGAVTALILAAAGLWAAIAQLIGPSGPSTQPTSGPSASVDAEVVAKRIQSCEQSHNMTKAQQVITSSDGLWHDFRFCVWPAPPYADRDGFIQITVEVAEGMAGVSEADGTGWADRIRGPCNTFEIAYDFGKQGVSQHFAPFTAVPGDLLIGGEGDRYDGPKGDLPFYPESDEVNVFHNGSYVIASVSCRN